VLRFFPNDVASFEPVVSLLVHLDELEEQQRQEGGSARVEDGEGLWEAQASGYCTSGSCMPWLYNAEGSV
jgi:hypothetical protein